MAYSLIHSAKAVLRKQMKTCLNSISTREKNRQSAIVAMKLFDSEIYQSSKRLSIFLNMNDEIETVQILKQAFIDEKMCFVPRYNSLSVEMQMVRLYSFEHYESLPETKWGIKQPGLNTPVEDAIESGGLDLILVPGLAFTKKGSRLGRGKGYYDTYFAKLKTIQEYSFKTVALAFNEQLVDEIPCTESDVPVDFVFTANGFSEK